MTSEEIKALRRELKCTTRDLAITLGVETGVVDGWETGETFPTKRYVDRLLELKAAGPSAILKRPKKGASPMQLLADPALWLLVRKLLVHTELRQEVTRLAERYTDPKES